MKLDFSKGIYTHARPINTPPGYYSDAENIRTSGASRRSEEGTSLTSVPSNIKIWGTCVIGDETIILGEASGKSVIGSLTREGTWSALVHRLGTNVLQINGPTQVEGRKNWAGERVIYFANSTGARRINLDVEMPAGDTDFDKITSLFLEYDLPKVTYVGERTTGQLTTGVYQLAARLLTDSGAATSFGINTNPIPVVQSSLQSARQDVVGNPPQTQTSKSVEVQISNIDTSFKYVQLGILTYVGDSNTPVFTVTNRITTNGASSLNYTYRGAPDDSENITTGDFVASGIQYSTGEFVAQKDGTLLLGSPAEQELPDIDWNRVAQGITAKYTIKEIPYAENISCTAENFDDIENYSLIETSSSSMDQGYKNPVTCELYKGYRRDEVYSFTFTPVFTSGVHGPTVHIPAPHSSNTSATGGNLGTYISEEKYPDDRYAGLQGLGLRLHKFPTAVEEPIISGNVTTSNCKLRVLGVKFEDIALHASETQYATQIAGFIIGRVNRKGNETQLAQGIVRPHTNVKFLKDNTHARCSMLGDGYVTWHTSIRDSTAYYTNEPSGTPDMSDFNFIGPDLIHNLYEPGDASHIHQHSIYSADPYIANVHNTILVDAKYDQNNFGMPRVFFKNVEGANTQYINQTKTELDGLKVEVTPFGVPLADFEQGGQRETTILKGSKSLKMASSDGFVWMGTVNDVNIQYHRDHQHYYNSYCYAARDDSGDTKIYMKPSLPLSSKVDFVLHTLSRQDTKQYGALDQMVSMFTHYQEWQGFTGDVEFYNGDTFISKYGLTINDESNHSWPPDGGNVSFVENVYPSSASGVVNMFIESSNNYDYRHYIQPTSFNEDNIDSVSGSVPFFPAYKQLASTSSPLGILSMKAPGWTRPGYARQYNNQYSAQPTIKPYAITPPEDVERKQSLVNRIAYSVGSVQGEKNDGYQIFLPNNYYDLPLQYGELTDLYVNQELFASTAQVQWRLFYNTLATQTTSAGEIVLGTGGAFNRPAEPLATVDGGYGGTSHWTHAINTVFGRVILDKRQGKLFMLREGLEHISSDLDDMARVDIQSLDDSVIKIGSEPLRERAYIRLGDDMYTYKLPDKTFISRHTYKPRWFFTHGPLMYSNVQSALEGIVGTHLHSNGPTGMFYGNLHPSSITLVANQKNDISKIFSNIELITRKTTEAGTNLPFDTFDQLEVWNDERYSGKIKLTTKTSAFQQAGILEELSNKVSDSFRIDMPRDIVIDPNISIFDVSNHKQRYSDVTPALWLPKMRGNFIELKLTTNNTDGPLYLHSAKLGVKENIR